MEVEETLLPGVGVRYDLRTRDGNLLGLVLQREGAVEVAVYDRRDPDRARGVLRLLASGAFAARRDGIGRAGQLRAGAALVARGEFSIVIAGLAVAGGLDEVGVVATGYVLVMAVIGPVLARFVEPLAARAGALPRDLLRPAR